MRADRLSPLPISDARNDSVRVSTRAGPAPSTALAVRVLSPAPVVPVLAFNRGLHGGEDVSWDAPSTIR